MERPAPRRVMGANHPDTSAPLPCSCLTRRHFLGSALCGSTLLLSGCDGPPDLVPTETVEEMGLEAWSQIRASVPLSSDTRLQAALTEVSTRLLTEMGETPAAWEMQVFASPDINAFALPGRKIGIYEGMFQVIETPDQLAAIVGHEIGHLAGNHAQERISAQVAADAGLRIIAWLLNAGEVEYADEIGAALGLGAQLGLLLPYSRSHELEADAFGLRAMVDAGYRGQEAITLWQRMDQVAGPRAPQFLATHPVPETRIEELRELLDQIQAG